MQTLAILVAAGRGERMGVSRPKAFLEVGGKSLLVWAAEALAASPCVDGLVAVVPGQLDAAAQRLLEPVAKPVATCAGGPRRQDSVLEGLKHVPDGFDGIVLVHDAARPFVEPATIASVVRAAVEVGAAVPVLGLTDTIKKVGGGRVETTLDRSTLAAAQTPQGFRYELLVRAFEEAFRGRVELTDEAMAVERIGLPVAAVAGSTRNRKLTTPEDLAWAEQLLAAERSGARA